jgi:hypothetical protein
VQFIEEVEDPGEELLDRVFFALSDPVRRTVLERLGRWPRSLGRECQENRARWQAVSMTAN